MASTARSASEPTVDTDSILGDIATLKQDLAKLMHHLKIGAKDGINGATEQVNAEATRVYETLAAHGERSAKALSRQVEEQPITAVLVAFAVGFVGGRMLSR